MNMLTNYELLEKEYKSISLGFLQRFELLWRGVFDRFGPDGLDKVEKFLEYNFKPVGIHGYDEVREYLKSVPLIVAGERKEKDYKELFEILQDRVRSLGISIDKVDPIIRKDFYRILRATYDAILDAYPTNGLTMIKEASAEYGRLTAERLIEQGWDKKDIKSIGDLLLRMFNTVDPGVAKITSQTDDEVVIRAKWCSYPLKDHTVCISHLEMEYMLVRILSGGTLEHSIGKSIPCGDPYCEHVVSKVK